MSGKKTKDMQVLMRGVMEQHIAFNRYLGLKVESFEVKAPKLRLQMRPELVGNPSRQILHGGVISATLDVAGGFAIMLSVLAENAATPTTFPNMGTIDLRVDYLRPGRGKYFIATARVVQGQPHRGDAHGTAQRRGRADRHRRCRLRRRLNEKRRRKAPFGESPVSDG